MSTSAAVHMEPAPIRACTVSRDVQRYDLLIEDMESIMGEDWGDLPYENALAYLDQNDAETLEFIAIALDSETEEELLIVSDILLSAQERGIKVVVIAEQIAPAVLHRLLRSGADDFVPYPLPEGALAEAVERFKAAPPPQAPAPAEEKIAPSEAPPGHEAAILPVQGLAGGVGATTLAVNLAWELSRPPTGKRAKLEPAPRVLLMDLDFQFGSVATYLDLPRRDSVYELLSDVSTADRDAFMNCLEIYKDRLHVLTAPADMLPLDIIEPDDMTRLLELASSSFDFIVIDMPTTVVGWTETVLNAADVYFALLELDMRSAQNTLRMLRTLKAEELPFEKLRYVLNRAPGFTDLGGKARVKRMAESLDIDIDVLLPDGQKQVGHACDHGVPLGENSPKLPLRKEILKLSEQLRAHAADAHSVSASAK
jgi:pilus assembly protein CpaE